MKKPISFNGKELPSFIRVTGIELPVTPEISPITQYVPRMNGLIDIGTEIKGASYKFDYVVVLENNMNIFQARDIFEEWLRGDNYKESKLIFREQPDKYQMARVTGGNTLKDQFLYGDGSFQMSCSKFIKYESKMTTKQGKNSVIVDYNGSLKTQPTVKIKLDKEYKDILLTHTESGKSVFFIGSFKLGDTLVIDNARKLVTLNGAVNMKILDLRTEWQELQLGKNTFQLYTGKALTQSADLTVEYQRKWQ